MAQSIIPCHLCGKSFLKNNQHINENKRFGHKFYCSRQCQNSSKNKQVELVCENPTCYNRFKRTFSKRSFRNFCSSQCAMKILGPENGKKHTKYKYCECCGKKILYKHTYCSPKCWGLAHRIDKNQLINRLHKLAKTLGRTPTKRECDYSNSCQRWFGSWNNALIAAGLTPHRSLNQKMYKRRLCIAADSHKCNSVSELIIDNWLYKNEVSHQKETSYPKGKFIADWSLSANVFVEYFGLANDSRRYDQEIIKKRQICQEFNIRLIEIYSRDLFPKNLLEQIFK